jgi:ribosomal protein L11 methyltransferase
VAVHTALDNAKGNGVLDRFTADADAPDARGPVDTVIANILAGTLIELADVISRSVASPGRLFLSGILVDQERAVRDAYTARGLRHTNTSTKNGWVRIDFAR